MTPYFKFVRRMRGFWWLALIAVSLGAPTAAIVTSAAPSTQPPQQEAAYWGTSPTA